MTLRIQHNADAIAATLDAVGKKQFPFAMANALNRTAEEGRDLARRKLPSQFTLRSATSRRFLEQLYNIRKEDRATKSSLVVRVGIQDPMGKSFKGRSALLAKFEEGGVRTTPPGGKPLLYPTDYLRPQPRAVIPQTLYPSRLGLTETRRISGGVRIRGIRQRQTKGGTTLTSLRGRFRTFALDPRFHPGARAYGVWQREGDGSGSETNRLWLYVSRSRYPKRISFVADTQALVKSRLAINVQGQMAYARNERKQFRATAFERVARAQGRV